MSVTAKQRPRAGRRARTATLALALALPAWAAPAAGEIDYGALNARLADEHIIPRYAALADSAAALRGAVDSLCATPDAGSLATARRAFHDAMDRWMRVEHVRIGPMERDLNRQRLYFWPDFRGRGHRQLSGLLAAGDDARLAPERFGKGSVAIQGLPALERLLFAGTPGDFAEDGAPSFRCRLAAAIGANVAAVTRAVHEGWTAGEPSFRTVFVDPAAVETHFLEPRQTTAELFRGYYEQIRAIEQLKLRTPLGEDADDASRKRFESWRSARTGRNLRLNTEALRALYNEGFARLLRVDESTDDRWIDRRMDTAFTNLTTALEGVEGNLAAAAETPEGHKEVELVEAYVEVLARLVAVELAEALGFATGFNSLDGD